MAFSKIGWRFHFIKFDNLCDSMVFCINKRPALVELLPNKIVLKHHPKHFIYEQIFNVVEPRTEITPLDAYGQHVIQMHSLTLSLSLCIILV